MNVTTVRQFFASGVAVLAVLAWGAWGAYGFYVEQKLISLYGTYELPQGERRWDAGLYPPGAAVWLERDRRMHRWDRRAWVAILVGATALAALIAP